MRAFDRQRLILDLLEERESIAVRDLEAMLHVSAMTLWRDLILLEKKGMLRRVHGGAIRFDAKREPHFQSKESVSVRIKQRIAAYAAKNFVSAGHVIILEGGTTIAGMIPHLQQPDLTILTNSLPIMARIHSSRRLLPVLGSGGSLSPVSGNFTGQEAVRFFQSKSAHIFFMSATGIDDERGVTDPNPLEIEVKQAMASAARRVILLVDGSKFGKFSVEEVIPLEKISEIVTDSSVPKSVLAKFRQRRIPVTAIKT